MIGELWKRCWREMDGVRRGGAWRAQMHDGGLGALSVRDEVLRILPHAEDCAAAYPERMDAAEVLARHQYEAGMHGEAAGTLEGCLRSFRTDEGAVLLMGRIELARGRSDVAVMYFREALAREPLSLDGLLGLAEASERAHGWTEAEWAAGQYLEREPGEDRARVVLGRCLLRRGERGQALEVLRNPQPAGIARAVLVEAVVLAGGGRWEEARVVLRRGLVHFPEEALAWRFLGMVSRKCGDTVLALEAEVKSRTVWRLARMRERKRLEVVRAEALARMVRRQSEGAVYPPGMVLQLTVVSGLPGSGAGAMMELLAAGGLPVAVSERRRCPHQHADWHWEWDGMHALSSDPRVLERVAGRVIMIPSGLMGQLDPKHEYRVVWMRRPVAEVLNEQFPQEAGGVMIPVEERDALLNRLERHVELLRQVLRERPQVEMLEVDYEQMWRDPERLMERLAVFFGDELTGSSEAMREVLGRLAGAASEPISGNPQSGS